MNDYLDQRFHFIDDLEFLFETSRLTESVAQDGQRHISGCYGIVLVEDNYIIDIILIWACTLHLCTLLTSKYDHNHAHKI